MSDFKFLVKNFYENLLNKLGFLQEKRILYLILLVGVALIGLVSLQLYWVNNLVSANNERFNQNTYEVLERVAERLEKHEAIYLVKEKISSFRYDKDSTTTDESEDFNKQKITKKQIYKGGRNNSGRVAVHEETFITNKGIERKSKISELNDGGYDIELSIYNRRKNSKKLDLSFIERHDLIGNITKSYLKSKDITERLNYELLDSVINIEVVNKGIKTPYVFGVMCENCEDENKILYLHDDKYLEEIKNSNFKIELFKDDYIIEKNFLKLIFPEQDSYLASTIGTALASAGVLILLILLAFVFAIYTINRQKQLSVMKNDFVNNMTHEFKTPIATISLACEMLGDKDIRQIPSQFDRYLGIISSENVRLQMQVEKVLQIATLDRGNFKLKVNQVDIHRIINKAIQNIVIQIENRQGELDVQLNAENSIILGDEVHLTNIIHNLLDNANKYSPETPKIKIETQNLKKGVIIKISDNGQGISKDAINKVFEKFYRVHTGNVHDVKGFGLGLSYVKAMVDAHRGKISVKSEINKGSVFTIMLPFKNE